VNLLALPPLLLLAAPVPTEAPRAALEALAARMEAAASRVSMATPAFLGSTPRRAYRIPGVGAVVVLPSRVLAGFPQGGQMVRSPLPGGPGGVPLMKSPVTPGQGRREIERALLELRSSLVREAEASQMVSTLPLQGGDLQALQREADERRVAAARARLEAQRALLAALQAASQNPHPAARMSDPQWEMPPVVTADGPAPLPFAVLDRRLGQAPAEAVLHVRQSLVEALVRERAVVSLLAPGESVSVAVDFIAVGLGAGGTPQRTLVVRASADDLRAAAEGTLTPSALARRVSATEY
jgi:hypothetical protein